MHWVLISARIQAIHPEAVFGVFQSLQANARILLRTGYGCFLSHPYKMIIHPFDVI
jgi:hypothetical protein